MVRHLTLVIFLLVLTGFAGCASPAKPAPAAPLGTPALATPTTAADPFTGERAAMVHEQIAGRGMRNSAVLAALSKVQRHHFVPEEYVRAAYADHPLPIGYGQTISQPYIVALMSEALAVQPGDRVLEIGTGSGYQAAVLAEMGAEVYTVEIIPELARQAAAALNELGYANVHTQNADGYSGWEAHAPYDAIIVTAAPDHLPQALAQQLKEGGRLVIPIGPTGSVQTLWLFEKQNGELTATNLGAVSFVPLTGGTK